MSDLISVDLVKLEENLTKTFITYVHRLEHPMPSQTETPAIMHLRFNEDAYFRAKVILMVRTVMEAVKVSESIEPKPQKQMRSVPMSDITETKLISDALRNLANDAANSGVEPDCTILEAADRLDEQAKEIERLKSNFNTFLKELKNVVDSGQDFKITFDGGETRHIKKRN